MDKKHKKKTTKKKMTKKNDLSPKTKGIILTAALVMVLCVLGMVYSMLGKYDGLGLKQPLTAHDYRMTHVVEIDGRLSYEDEHARTLTGIDVSVFQGGIDWEAVKADGVDFAIIRLGYRGSGDGGIYLDEYFKQNIKGAKKAGLDIGVYFFSQAITPEEAIEEARFVVKKIRGKGVNYPVAFDMEPMDGTERAANLTVKQKTEIADAFCQVIKRNGFTPMVYGNPQWLYGHIDLSYLTEYDTWLAHYASSTHYEHPFKMWQYTDSGIVDGIEGPVDMNLYFVEKD